MILQDLPSDSLLQIFAMLEFSDLLHLERTCSAFLFLARLNQRRLKSIEICVFIDFSPNLDRFFYFGNRKKYSCIERKNQQRRADVTISGVTFHCTRSHFKGGLVVTFRACDILVDCVAHNQAICELFTAVFIHMRSRTLMVHDVGTPLLVAILPTLPKIDEFVYCWYSKEHKNNQTVVPYNIFKEEELVHIIETLKPNAVELNLCCFISSKFYASPTVQQLSSFVLFMDTGSYDYEKRVWRVAFDVKSVDFRKLKWKRFKLELSEPHGLEDIQWMFEEWLFGRRELQEILLVIKFTHSGSRELKTTFERIGFIRHSNNKGIQALLRNVDQKKLYLTLDERPSNKTKILLRISDHLQSDGSIDWSFFRTS